MSIIKFEQDKTVTSTKICHVGFILDGSASMAPFKEETIRGFNYYLKDAQAELPDNTLFTFGVFINGKLSIRARRTPLMFALPLNRLSYGPGGGTPLYDSMMNIIFDVEFWKNQNKEGQPIIVIQTDGEDISSKRFKLKDVKKKIIEKTAEGWQFILIATDVNARRLGNSMSIDPGCVLDFSRGKTENAFKATSRLTARMAGADKNEKPKFMLEDRRDVR